MFTFRLSIATFAVTALVASQGQLWYQGVESAKAFMCYNGGCSSSSSSSSSSSEAPSSTASESSSEGSSGVAQGGHRGAGSAEVTYYVGNLLSNETGVAFDVYHRKTYTVTTNTPEILQAVAGNLIVEGDLLVRLDKTYPMDSNPPSTTGGIYGIPKRYQRLICRTQVMLNRHQDFLEGRLLVSVMISYELGLPHGAVYVALGSKDYCKDIFRKRLSVYGAVSRAKRSMMHLLLKERSTVVMMDQDGVPVSSNPAWNACIRRTVLRDASGRPYNCRRYHSGNHWYYPDSLGLEFAWNPRDPRGIRLPYGYTQVALTDLEVALLSESMVRKITVL